MAAPSDRGLRRAVGARARAAARASGAATRPMLGRSVLRARYNELAAGLAGFHDLVSLADLLEGEYSRRWRLVVSGLDLLDDLLQRNRRDRVRIGAYLEAPEEAELHAARQVEDRQEVLDGTKAPEEPGLADAATLACDSQRIAQHPITDEVDHAVDATGDELAHGLDDVACVDQHIACTERAQCLDAVLATRGGDHPRTKVPRDVHRRLAEGRSRAPDEDALARLELEVAVQSHPRRSVALGDRSKLGEVERRLDLHDVRRGCRDVLRVAAVSRAAEPAHDRDHGRALGERAGRVVDYGARRLDAADRRGFRPLALSHVRLGVVDPERLDANQHFSLHRDGLRQLLELQNLWPTWLRDDHRTHF